MTTSRSSGREVEQAIGRLLRAGVLLSAAVVLLGAVILLAREAGSPTDYATFRPEQPEHRSIGAILRGAFGWDGRAIVQLGLIVLIATPVARVALTLVAFMIQRDRLYVLITGSVLALLCYSLLVGR